MEQVQGTVLSILAVAGHREALLDVNARAVCARCAEGKGCGAGVFGGSDKDRHLQAVIADGVEVEEGQRVDVAMQSGGILNAAGTVYGLPLAGALAGATAAWGMGLGDSAAAGLAVLGLMGGFGIARRRVKAESCLRRMRPVVTSVCRDD